MRSRPREDCLSCLALGGRLPREVGLMICTGYIKSAWRTGAVWELLAEQKHRTKSQCDWPPPRLYLEVAYIGENRAVFFFCLFFFYPYPPLELTIGMLFAIRRARCLIRKTSQFHQGSRLSFATFRSSLAQEVRPF